MKLKKYTIIFHYNKIEGLLGLPFPHKRKVTLYSSSVQCAKAEARFRVPIGMKNCMQTIDYDTKHGEL